MEEIEDQSQPEATTARMGGHSRARRIATRGVQMISPVPGKTVQFAKDHPVIVTGAVAVGFGVAVVATGPALLGFTAAGVAPGSVAASVQAAMYGAAVPAGSLFAQMQSVGVLGTTLATKAAGGVIVAIPSMSAANRWSSKAKGPQSDREAQEKAHFLQSKL